MEGSGGHGRCLGVVSPSPILSHRGRGNCPVSPKRCSRMLPGSGVSPIFHILFRKNGGFEDGVYAARHPGQVSGLTLTLTANFAWLYPPCDMGLMNQAPTRLRFGRSAHRGVQRDRVRLPGELGVSPIFHILFPKSGGFRGLSPDTRNSLWRAFWIPAYARK